jgi:hypothetical protein
VIKIPTPQEEPEEEVEKSELEKPEKEEEGWSLVYVP